MRIQLAFIGFVVLFLAACSTIKKPYVESSNRGWELQQLPDSIPLSETLFLVGNAGYLNPEKEQPVWQLLQQQMQAADSNSSVVFLGNNVAPNGLTKKFSNDIEAIENELIEMLHPLQSFKGDVYLIPGYTDWAKGKDGGRKAVKKQEDFIQNYLNRGDVFVPDNACADPEEEEKNDGLVYLFIDSQWWLNDWDNFGKMNNGCEVDSRQVLLESIHQFILENKGKQIVVFMHHPLFSNGIHGGNFSFKHHIFPFTVNNKKAYIPLPILGSFYIFGRSTTGAKQDIISRKYHELKEGILQIVDKYSDVKDIIFVSGQEENLQYFNLHNQHFVNSGSIAEVSYARKGGKAEFVQQAQGFSKILYYTNGETWLEFWVVNKKGEGELSFRKQITPAKAHLQYVPDDGAVYELPDSITAVIQPNYGAGNFKKFWLGEQYRKAWTTSWTVPVINLSTELGGLTPIKKGGGQASNSLRLETIDGHQYGLRSVDKNIRSVFPVEIQQIKALNLLQDQISATHPFGALLIPPLADAVGVYHTNPKVVYLVNQPRLGVYNSLFPDGFYLFEERPAGNWSELASFGNSEKIIGYIDLLAKLKEDEKNQVDQESVLRSRIFDLFVHDWDRHDDQWRWAKFKEGDLNVYRPIPRDRDQVFYKFRGVLPWLVHTFVVTKFKSFRPNLKRLPAQSFNARNFDRYFLNELTREDWRKTAVWMQQQLTDSLIDSAFNVWPDSLYALYGAEMAEILKSRRNHLETIALKLYTTQSRRVEVTGTNRNDAFVVERLTNGNTLLRIYHQSKKGNKKDLYYEREFIRGETKQINLFGLDGDDVFEITGKVRHGMIVRIVGGQGNDNVFDQSKVVGLMNKTKVYDEPDGITIDDRTAETVDKTTTQYDINAYDRERFLNKKYTPVVGFSTNPDDGFFIGGGFVALTYRFRKEPYATKQMFKVLLSLKNGAFSIDYWGDFIGTFRRLDTYIFIDFKSPEYVNYFGMGNATLKTVPEDRFFNWVRMRRFTFAPQLKRIIRDGVYDIRIGLKYEGNDVIPVGGRVVSDPTFNLTSTDLRFRHYIGGTFSSVLTATDDKIRPQSGYASLIQFDYLNEIANADNGFMRLNAYLSTYVTYSLFGQVQVTLANRAGMAAVFGDYQFYHVPTLGALENLRGFRNERFRGKTLFYHNIDVRLKLLYWDNKMLPMEIGVYGGFDYGRVWHTSSEERFFHKGYTAGIWISPVNILVVSPYFSFSREEKWFFNIRTSFFF